MNGINNNQINNEYLTKEEIQGQISEELRQQINDFKAHPEKYNMRPINLEDLEVKQDEEK